MEHIHEHHWRPGRPRTDLEFGVHHVIFSLDCASLTVRFLAFPAHTIASGQYTVIDYGDAGYGLSTFDLAPYLERSALAQTSGKGIRVRSAADLPESPRYPFGLFVPTVRSILRHADGADSEDGAMILRELQRELGLTVRVDQLGASDKDLLRLAITALSADVIVLSQSRGDRAGWHRLGRFFSDTLATRGRSVVDVTPVALGTLNAEVWPERASVWRCKVTDR